MAVNIVELYNIMPIANIASVLEHGIVSHSVAADLEHTDVSMADVQDKRDTVRVPGGLKLHEYANLYFDARNPMMSRRRGQASSLCVLGVSPDVLTLPNVVITDQNAASDYVRFYTAKSINFLNFDLIYAEDWRHDDLITYWRQKSAKCAEVLVPSTIEEKYITKAYIFDGSIRQLLLDQGFTKPIETTPKMFFR